MNGLNVISLHRNQKQTIMNQQTEEKILNLLREHFNLYHSYVIMGMLTDDNISPQHFRQEVEKIKEAEKNDIDEYDNPEIAS